MSIRAGPSPPIPKAKGHLDAPTAPDNVNEDAAAESDDSFTTQEYPAEMILKDTEAAREQKIRLGGRPTRPIGEYRQEDSRLIRMADDHPRANDHLGRPRSPVQRTVPFEVRQYEYWCLDEKAHFRSELLAWESFLRSMRRDWVARDEAEGGNVPPPPPVLEWDPLDLHNRYLDFLLQIRERDETTRGEKKWDLNRFRFGPYSVFLDHIDAVCRQVAEMRERHGIQDQPSTRGAETKGNRSSQSNPQPSPPGGKRAREDEPGESTTVLESTTLESQDNSHHPPKRRKLRSSTYRDDIQEHEPAPGSTSRVSKRPNLRSKSQAVPKSKATAANLAAQSHDRDARSKRGKKGTDEAVQGQKANSKVPHTAEASGTSKPGPSPKQRGRKAKPKKSQQIGKPVKSSGGPSTGKHTGTVKRQSQTDPPVAGVRRSARIAAANARAKVKAKQHFEI